MSDQNINRPIQTKPPQIKADKREDAYSAFVAYVIERIGKDNAYRAAMSRGDNSDTEYQAYEYLAGWCDIEKSRLRAPYALIGAALARSRTAQDGEAPLGRALADCYEESDAGKARLRRLLACSTPEEACSVLRPLLRLIEAKGKTFNHAGLLRDLVYFKPERQRSRWAAQFFRREDNSNTGSKPDGEDK